ncbi:hypothetical protein ACTSKR_00565 [Chitinibacteraceae bacterium HSL-7]
MEAKQTVDPRHEPRPPFAWIAFSEQERAQPPSQLAESQAVKTKDERVKAN